MEITRSADTDTTTWTGSINGADVAWLSVWTVNGEISSVEVRRAHMGQGYARDLYTRADADFRGGIFHTIAAHRSDDGDGFARAVGGDTIDADDAVRIDACCCDSCDAA